MASSNIFQMLRERVEKSDGLLPQERRAMLWFQTYRTDLLQWQNQHRSLTYNGLSDSTFAKKVVRPKAILPGYLYFFLYFPHYARTLDYYDRFPMTLVLEKDPEGFLALNFHYLPYQMRAIFFDALYSRHLQSNTDPLRSRIRITYQILSAVSKYKAFRPCLRRYRYTNCRSAMLQVGETEWDIALFLPVEQFTKATRAEVWKESMHDLRTLGNDDNDDTAAGEDE